MVFPITMPEFGIIIIKGLSHQSHERRYNSCHSERQTDSLPRNAWAPDVFGSKLSVWNYSSPPSSARQNDTWRIKSQVISGGASVNDRDCAKVHRVIKGTTYTTAGYRQRCQASNWQEKEDHTRKSPNQAFPRKVLWKKPHQETLRAIYVNIHPQANKIWSITR